MKKKFLLIAAAIVAVFVTFPASRLAFARRPSNIEGNCFAVEISPLRSAPIEMTSFQPPTADRQSPTALTPYPALAHNSQFSILNSQLTAEPLSPSLPYNSVIKPTCVYSDDSGVYISGAEGVFKFDSEGNYLAFAPVLGVSKFVVYEGFIVAAEIASPGFSPPRNDRLAVYAFQAAEAVCEVSVPGLISFCAEPSGGELLIWAAAADKITNYKLQITNEGGQTTNYKLQITSEGEIPLNLQNISDLTTPSALGSHPSEGGEFYAVADDITSGGARRALYKLDIASGLTETALYTGYGLDKIAVCEESNIIISASGGLLSINPTSGVAEKRYDYNSKGFSDGGLASVCSLSASGGVLCALDPYCGVLQGFDYALKFKSNIIAAGGGELGRFAAPSYAYVSGDKLLVTEQGNNRVSIVGSNSANFVDYSFINPYLAATGMSGKTYVADSGGTRLSVFDVNYKFLTQKTFTKITSLYAGANNMLYVADSGAGKIYAAGVNDSFEVIAELLNLRHIALKSGENAVYATDGAGGLYRAAFGGAVQKLTAPAITGAFDIDYAGNIFELSDNKIYKYSPTSADEYGLSAEFTLKTDIPVAKIRNLTSIKINSQYSPLAPYGAIILADSGADCVFAIEGENAGVVMFDGESYTGPLNYLDKTPFAEVLEIRTATAAATLYKYPDPNSPLLSLASGTKLMVLQYDLPDNEYFSYVLFDAYPLAAGYVLKSQLSAPLANTGYTYPIGRVVHANTPVYKYPSSYSPLLEGALAKDSEVNTAAFCYPYTDAAGAGFLAIALSGGGMGYVRASGVIPQNYEPTDPNKFTDAKILTQNSLGAPLYTLIDGEYVLMPESPLGNGTRVKVVGKYDRSAPYTEIIVYTDIGQYRAYVETRYVSYDSATLVQVAAVLCIFAALLIAVIIVVFYAKKKAR